MQSDHDSGVCKIIGHLIFAAIGILGGGMVVVVGTLGGQDIVSAGVAAAGVTGFATVAHLMLTFCEPVVFTRRHGLALAVAIVAPIAFLIPWLFQPAAGWPVNAEDGARDANSYSRVIAPGDVATLDWYPQEIKSVSGRWSGTPKTTVRNAAELGCGDALPTTGGRDENWGIIIGATAKTPRIRPDVHIPDDEHLAGKSLEVQITLPMTYPSPVGEGKFEIENATLVHDATILLATRKSKQAYSLSWILGTTIGMSATVAGGLMMVWLSLGLRRVPSVAVQHRASQQVQGFVGTKPTANAAMMFAVKLGGSVLAIFALPLLLNWCFDQKNIALENAVERLGGTAYRAVAEQPENTPIDSNHSMFTSCFHPVLFLDLSGCDLIDDDLERICQLATPSLQHIKLDNNRGITDASIARLNQLITLETVSVKNTSMTKSGVRRLMIHPGYYPGGASHRDVYHSF